MHTFKKFFNKQQLLTLVESEMLDISILNIDKAKKKILELLDVPVTVTEKTDGVKLTIVRTNTPLSSNWKHNWIVSYKGNVIYPEDLESIDDETTKKIKQHSIGVSQFKFVFDVLKEAQKNPKLKEIPQNTELFFEFLMKKPTLTREYTNIHQLILLSSSPTKYKEEFGRLITKSEEFDISKRNKYAQILNVKTPAVLFNGTLNKLVGSETNADNIINILKSHFLKITSEHGGIMEGVVLEFNNGTFLKIVQEDQYSKEVRQKIKQKHAPITPEHYYQEIAKLSQKILNEIGTQGTMKELLTKLSTWIYAKENSKNFEQLDPNKTDINAKDDVLLTAKALLLKKLPGNNNALVIGRFSPLTIAHYNIINNALEQYDHVVVNIVKSKLDVSNPFPIEIQKKMLDRCFYGQIEIIVTETGNLLKSIQKCSKTINVVLAGSDRVETYKKQLENNKDIEVKEIPRIDEVSGTKVRKSLVENDIKTFKQNTPSQLWDMFQELKEYVDSVQ
jgi:nicotinamide mononucleotide adenylyltransferase